jgi:hypothetical protein
VLIGICGEEFGNPIGNLKTYTMTWCLFQDYLHGNTIYSNYGLNFPHHKIESRTGLREVLQKMDNVSVGLDEFHVYFSGYDSVSRKNGNYDIMEFGKQTRKRKVKLYGTGQTLLDFHKSIRRLMVKVWVTKKLHYNFIECFNEYCEKPHILEVHDLRADMTQYYKVNPKIFTLYNSDEIVDWRD